MAELDARARFDMGRVLNRATGAIGRNLGLLATLAVVLEVFPGILVRTFGSFVAASPAPGGIPTMSLTGWIGTFVTLACFCVMIGALINVVVVDQQGRRPELGATLTLGARRAIPMIVMFVVMYVPIVLGIFLFFVPGVILTLMWVVAAPVLVEENAGIFGSLGRSRALTKGARWSIFLMLLALAILQLVILGGILLLVGTYSSASGAGWVSSALVATNQGFGPVAIAYLLANIVLSIVLTVVIAAIYVELRFIREGDRPDSLVEVFA